MKLLLPIDPFQLTQEFGENPNMYKKFGLKAHNGWDIKTKYPDTPVGQRYIIAPQNVQFYKQSIDPPGYGIYFEVITKAKSLWKHTFAHCHSIETFTEKKQGESMAISDNTGNSTGGHLNWTVKKIKILNSQHEVQDYNNGYFGAVNPQEYVDEVRNYNGTQPMPNTNITIEGSLYEKLVGNSTKWDEMVKYLEISSDPASTSFEDVQRVVAGLKSRITDIQTQLGNTQAELENRMEQVSRLKEQVLNNDKLRGELIQKLSDTVSEQQGMVGVYEKRLKEIQGGLEAIARTKGELNKALLECKSQSTIEQLTIADVLVLLFNKLKQIKLK